VISSDLVGWLDPEELRRQCHAFLARYNAADTLPLPIEEIVEFEMGINIIDIPGLQDRLGTVGFISSDLREISVDKHVAESVPTRFRFTIAHEVGHVVLHEPNYRSARFATPEEWKAWINAMSPKMFKRLESQANMFASRILVPVTGLRSVFESYLDRAEAAGLDWEASPEVLFQAMAKDFGVAAEVIKYRLVNEGLISDPRLE
jgi:Zn-dependent peptidase ImmA (M78 family)